MSQTIFEIRSFIVSEISELETRDIDQLYECILENVRELGYGHDSIADWQIFSIVESELAKVLSA